MIGQQLWLKDCVEEEGDIPLRPSSTMCLFGPMSFYTPSCAVRLLLCWLDVAVASQVVVGFFSIACHNNFLDACCSAAKRASASEVVVRSACTLTTSMLWSAWQCVRVDAQSLLVPTTKSGANAVDVLWFYAILVP